MLESSEKESSKNESEEGQNSMVLQLQHLQSGKTWRLTSLIELNELLKETVASGGTIIGLVGDEPDDRLPATQKDELE
jgi:hypothetical protein